MSEVYAVSTFETQEKTIEQRCKALDTQLVAVENIIKHPRFLSDSIEMYDSFMFAVSRAWSLVVTTTPALGLSFVSPTGHPVDQTQASSQPAPTGVSEKTSISWITVVVLAGLALVGLYLDRTTALQMMAMNQTITNSTRTMQGVGTTQASPTSLFMFILAVMALLVVAPKILEEISKLILKDKKVKEPETLTSWLAKRLGWETWKNGKFWDGGIMVLYWMAFNLSPHLEIAAEAQEQFSDPNNPAIADGLRGYWRTQFRGKFRARIAEVRTLIEEAKAQRIAEIRQHTVDVSKAPAISPRGAR